MALKVQTNPFLPADLATLDQAISKNTKVNWPAPEPIQQCVTVATILMTMSPLVATPAHVPTVHH